MSTTVPDPTGSAPPTRVLCVDDNPDMTAALRLIIGSDPSMVCVGCLASASDLIAEVRRLHPPPDVLILDATMAGTDPFTAMKELAAECPGTRAIIYSGHDDPSFVERAVNAGAWGCVSKHEEPEAIVRAVREVAAGRMLRLRR